MAKHVKSVGIFVLLQKRMRSIQVRAIRVSVMLSTFESKEKEGLFGIYLIAAKLIGCFKVID